MPQRQIRDPIRQFDVHQPQLPNQSSLVTRGMEIEEATSDQQIDRTEDQQLAADNQAPLFVRGVQLIREEEMLETADDQQIDQPNQRPLVIQDVPLIRDVEMGDVTPIQCAHTLQPRPFTMILAQQIEQYKCLIVKKDKQIDLFKATVNRLNDKIGAEDLTVQIQKNYETVLLSSADEQSGSDESDSSDGESGEKLANKENILPDVQSGVQTDMDFSFSHQFRLNVSIYSLTLFLKYFISNLIRVFLKAENARDYQAVHITIPRHGVKILKALNKTPVFMTMAGDGKYIEILLKCVFATPTLKMATYDTLAKPKILFIKGNY